MARVIGNSRRLASKTTQPAGRIELDRFVCTTYKYHARKVSINVPGFNGKACKSKACRQAAACGAGYARSRSRDALAASGCGELAVQGTRPERGIGRRHRGSRGRLSKSDYVLFPQQGGVV